MKRKHDVLLKLQFREVPQGALIEPPEHENVIYISFSGMGSEEVDKSITLYDLKKYMAEAYGVAYEDIEINELSASMYRTIGDKTLGSFITGKLFGRRG